MTVKLYIGVEGVLLHRKFGADGRKRGFEPARYGLDFLGWAALALDCHWLTRLDRRGGDYRIRRAFRLALGIPRCDNDLEVLSYCIKNDLEVLSYCIKPTYWERCMAEAIDLPADFYWITNDPDEPSLAVLERRALMKRLIRCSAQNDPHEFATIKLRLEPFAD